MIYCVWYPSGGFGHFINFILSSYGDNFMRPSNTGVNFSKTGDSHGLPVVAPKYKNNVEYVYTFLPNVNYSVLIDNGINNESQEFIKLFPNAHIIKLCYTDFSWPVVAKTMIVKAMKSSIEDELSINQWGNNDDCSKREKYFLFLRDHELRYQWRSNLGVNNVYIETLFSYEKLKTNLEQIGIRLDNFDNVWQQWAIANDDYIAPTTVAKNIIEWVKTGVAAPLDVTDIWCQAIVYYYIWLEFNVEVPHNDYSNWFTNTKEIVTMLNNFGVTV